MRVAIGGFQHETNTFSPVPGTYATFAEPDGWPGLTRGPAVIDALAGYNIGMAGLLEGARAAGWDIAPLAWCGGGASGTVTEEAFERISALLLDALAAALPVDGVLFDLHGAMVATHLEDGDGAFLRRLRTLVGPDIPVVCSLDLHANLTPEMVALSDMLVLCRSYPHLDMAETGRRAAGLLARLLAGEPIRHSAFRQIPFLIPTTRGCTMTEPARSLYAALAAAEAAPGIAHLSFACGFGPSDVPHCGPALVGYGSDPAAVEGAIDRLHAEILAREPDFALALASVAEGVRRACDAPAGPVILADVDDNAGGGESSDTTWILAELLAQGAEGAALGVLHDPTAAAAAHAAGRGATVTLDLGARSGQPGHRPVRGAFTVEAVSDGRFQSTGIYFAGAPMDLGPMAALRIAGVRIVVSSRREQAADRAMFTHLGIDPAAARILVLKSAVHFRADFQPIATEIIEVGAPDRDPAGLVYTRLRPGVRPRPLATPFTAPG